MTLPNFLVIGAQKAGTTWLASQLWHHPDVFMLRPEIHFFDRASNYEKGPGWYERHFEAARGKRAIGEKSPEYMWVGGKGPGHLASVHRNVHATMPDARLIAILRNPVERAISQLNHLIRVQHVAPLERIDDLLVGGRQHLVADSGVLDRGRYVHQLAAYRELFDPRQMLVLIYEEDVREQPREGLAKVCHFLGIDPSFEFPTLKERLNAADRCRLRLVLDYYVPGARRCTAPLDRWLKPWKGAPSQAATRELYGLYAEDNARLFELLGRETPASWTLARH
jgi:hypothetical protein